MTSEVYRLFVGVDWGSDSHQVAVLDHARRLLGERRVAHTALALGEVADWLAQRAGGEPGQVAVALEVPRGAVAETLLERGFHVYALNPKQLDRFRDRRTVAGAKDDRRDARVLADALTTDRPAFRRLQLDDPQVIQLRELSRLEDELDAERRRLANRLRDQLWRIYPPLLTLVPAADEPWLWSLLEQAPSPEAGRRLTRAAVAHVLAVHRLRRLTADDVVQALRTPTPYVAPGTVEAVREHLALLLPRLRLVHEQRQQCRGRLERLLEQFGEAPEGQAGHRDVTILRSLPGVGRLVSATMLAEAAGPVAARDYHGLRSQAGTAPVTRQSGKRREVRMRYACNRRLRNAVYHWARVCTQRDPHSRDHYARLRARGLSHGRALRTVADRLLAVLVAMLKRGTLYDPSHRRLAEAA